MQQSSVAPAGTSARSRSALRRSLALPALILALAVGGCAAPIAGTATAVASPQLSTSTGNSSPTVTPPTSSTSPSESEPVPETSGSTLPSAAAGVDPAAFAARMKAANASVKTLVGSISVTAGPITEQGTFSETLAGGRVSAMEMALFLKSNGENLPLKLLIVNGKIYLGGSAILAALKVTGKQWALASASSANASLRSLANQLDSFLESASASQYVLFAKAAQSIVDGGVATLGTVRAHKYVITVDVAKLGQQMTGATKASMDAVLAAGVTTIPSTIWLDPSGRVVQSSSTVTVGAVTSRTLFKVTAYNTPVVIKTPAPSSVYIG